ncbi:MAG: DNA-binding response regulator [Dehalococcoidia bacterium]|nr:DNA-binding response regulator [Dehalococcoidia bacterium]|tara:strand:- start:3700 stop:4395 length:696 start_codon:yes stop_codon:yes gene_type:complete
MSNKILVVEDEENILEAIKYALTKEGYEVHTAVDGEAALQLSQSVNPDLVVLDVMLPKLDGFEVCRIIRKDFDIPIFILSAKSEEIDRVVGLEIGADDYITKPFSMRELVVRIRNAMRRAKGISSKVNSLEENLITSGDLEIDLRSHKVTLEGTVIDMKPREFDLLSLLVSNKNRAFTRTQLLEQLWEYDYFGDIRTVDVHIRWIREKIEENASKPSRIITVRGVGYRFEG